MVFVYEKSLIIIMLMYSISFSALGMQYIVGDVFHFQMTDFQGNPVKNPILQGVGTATINAIGVNSTCITNTCHNAAVNPISYLAVAAAYAWDIFMLIAGLQIFNYLAIFGAPLIFLYMFIGLYLFLLVRSMMGWIRGITNNVLYAKLFQYNNPERIIMGIGHSMKNYLGISIIKISVMDSYNTNDVISFLGNNNVKYCHRIIRIDNDTFTAKGDNLSKSEDYEINVPIRKIEGKVIWSLPNWN